MKHCIEGSYKNKKTLIVIAVDFQKAFDCIDRGKLVETMMRYKINSQIIKIIADIYTGDNTELFNNNEKQR